MAIIVVLAARASRLRRLRSTPATSPQRPWAVRMRPTNRADHSTRCDSTTSGGTCARRLKNSGMKPQSRYAAIPAAAPARAESAGIAGRGTVAGTVMLGGAAVVMVSVGRQNDRLGRRTCKLADEVG